MIAATLYFSGLRPCAETLKPRYVTSFAPKTHFFGGSNYGEEFGNKINTQNARLRQAREDVHDMLYLFTMHLKL